MGKKPGVMVYFDILKALNELSREEQGEIFIAILEYGETRKLPTLSEKLRVMWPFLQQRLDYDELRYERVSMRRSYAAYVRWASRKGQEVLDFTEWQESKGYAHIDEEYVDPSSAFIPGS